MRHKQPKLFASVAIAANCLLGLSGAHAQGLGDVRAIKPVLMMVVDSSGSMERIPVSNNLPVCSGVDDTSQKNRWTGMLEATTGSFTGYACQKRERTAAPYTSTDYDYGYYLPHISRLPSVQQASDGALDALQYSVKFGLMTFDGQGTYQDGDPLISYASIIGSPSLSNLVGNPATSDDGTYAGQQGGMYSYGELKKLTFPGCVMPYGMNLGVRGPGSHAGALISVDASDDPIAVRSNNDRVQNSLLTVRPYGGTPVAAALDDLKYWLEKSPELRAPTDPFASCRDKYAVLITDGAPDTMYRDSRFMCEPGGTEPNIGIDRDGSGAVVGEAEECAGRVCSCPYAREATIAAQIVQPAGKLEKLFVVAFDVTDPAAITSLDAIAVAGNTTVKAVSTPAQLRTALSAIYQDSFAPQATSRTVPVTVDGTIGSFTPGAKSFEIRAGFLPNTIPDAPWNGFLERTPITCSGTSVSYATALAPEDEFHTQLNIQSAASSRRVRTLDAAASSMRGSLRTSYAALLDSSTYGGSTTPAKGPDGNNLVATTIAADSTTASSQGTVVGDRSVVNFSSSLSPFMFGDADKDGTPFEVEDVQYISRFLDGSSRPGNTLSDIYHSNPVAMGPLVTSGAGSRLGSWRKLLLDSYSTNGGTRPQVVFVGTNDGLLHAFNLDTWNGRGPGHELWSFVPPVLFDKLHTASAANHVFMFDGDMVLKDMYLGPRTDGNALLATRSILLAAVRGAPGYVALDVSNPDQEPKLLWQFSDPSLGDTVAKPQLVQVAIEWTTGVVQERAMAILPGGRGEIDTSVGCSTARGIAKARAPADARDNGRCWRNRGRVLFLVDVATGQLVQKFDQRHFPAPLTGSIGIDENRPLAQSAYFSDEDGVVWHLALDGTAANQWHVEPIWDVFHGAGPTAGRPFSYAPLVTRDSTGSNVLLLGTGDIDSLTDVARHRVVSLREDRVRNATTGFVTTSIKSVRGEVDTANWEIELAPYESVTGPLTLLDGTVYFSTFVAANGATDACTLGASNLWGVDFITRDLAAIPPLPVGKLAISNGPPPVFGRSQAAESNSVILGLSAGQDPLCLTGQTVNNPVNGTGFVATGGPAASTFHIRANMGSREAEATVGNSNLKLFERSFTSSYKSQVVGWAGSVE